MCAIWQSHMKIPDGNKSQNLLVLYLDTVCCIMILYVYSVLHGVIKYYITLQISFWGSTDYNS